MKYPCKECLVKPACSCKCEDYNRFLKFLRDTITPILVLVSVISCGGFMIFLALTEHFNIMCVYLALSWIAWIIFEEQTGFIDTLMSPFFLIGWVGMKLLKLIYNRPYVRGEPWSC